MSQDWVRTIRAPLTGNIGEDMFDDFLRVLRYNKPNFPVIHIAFQRFLEVGVPAIVKDMGAEEAEAFRSKMACHATTFQELWKQYIIDDCYEA